VAVVCLGGAVLSMLLPEPKGKSLEEMAEMSGAGAEFGEREREYPTQRSRLRQDHTPGVLFMISAGKPNC